MADKLYTNNFRGQAGRLERAKHIVREFAAIEDAFTKLQALNIATYLTTYINSTTMSGTITIRPDNGFLQELTLTADTAIGMAPPLNESQYRVSLLIHGSGFKVTNLWGAQTWKEYGQGNWWDLYTGEGPYASMLLDFFWDICSHTWICVASSKNRVDLIVAGTQQLLFPLQCNLWDVDFIEELGFTRADNAMGIDNHQAFHYFVTDEPRFYGARYAENWCATASDLTSVAWVATDCTVTTDAGAGPLSEDVQRLSFDVTGGKLAHFILPAFGRASTAADSIKVMISFKGRGVSQAESVRLYCSFMGKIGLDPPVHDVVQVAMDTTWQTYGAILDVTKEDNANYPMALDREYPRTLLEIAFASPSGSTGGDIQITDVHISVLRGTDDQSIDYVEDTTIGASIALTGTGTGSWVDGTKTLTLASVGQSVDLSGTLEIGKTYLVHPRLQAGDSADIRMANQLTVWAAGSPLNQLYLQDAPFTFQYDGGNLTFVLLEGVSSIYLVDVYEVSGNRGVYCYENYTYAGDNGELFVAIADPPVPVTSGILDGVAREIQSTNEIPFNFFRSFTMWDQTGLTGESVNDCRNPVFQSEYGIDGWPARATIVQGASRYTDGFIQRAFSLTPAVGGKDFTMWVRRSLDAEGNQTYFPQHNDVTTPLSRYVDFEAELSGGVAPIQSGRVRLDIQTGDFVGLPSGYNYTLGIFEWRDWWHVVISLQNDGTHDTFTVRVYPSSTLDNPDPSVVTVDNTGWVVIDWAQFEDTGGTYLGSSPIVGAETRQTEEFTSALPDGDFYRLENQENAGDAGHVATLTSGSVIWDDFDGVYRNLLYSTELLQADPNPRNMHEFGLVDVELPPSGSLQILTTTLFPLESIDGAQLAFDLYEMSMAGILMEDDTMISRPMDGYMTTILISTNVAEFDSMIARPVSGTLDTILISSNVEDYSSMISRPMDGTLDSKLVTALAPPEGAITAIDIDAGGWSLDPV